MWVIEYRGSGDVPLIDKNTHISHLALNNPCLGYCPFIKKSSFLLIEIPHQPDPNTSNYPPVVFGLRSISLSQMTRQLSPHNCHHLRNDVYMMIWQTWWRRLLFNINLIDWHTINPIKWCIYHIKYLYLKYLFTHHLSIYLIPQKGYWLF